MWIQTSLTKSPWIGLLLALLGVVLPGQAYADELVTLETRPGVQLKVMVMLPPATPKGVLIAYAGGNGTLGLDTLFGQPVIGNKDYAQAFVVRNRDKFVQAGYALLLPDAPSDRKTLNYMYRLGPQQVDDAIPLIDFARQRFGMAPWLLGTSASALTVGSLGGHPDLALGGIVLISSVTAVPSDYGVYRTHPEGTASTPLGAVRVPALVVAHQDDACELSPPADSAKLMARLSAAPRKAERLITGGDNPRSGPCFALSPHGFLGVEGEVEQAIFDFIEKPGT